MGFTTKWWKAFVKALSHLFLLGWEKTEKPPTWYYGIFGFVFNGFVASFIALCPLMNCIAGVDPTNFIFPRPIGFFQKSSHFSARFVLNFFAVTQMVSILCSSYLTICIGFHYFNTCLSHLQFYKSPTQWVARKGKRSGLAKPSQFHGIPDLQL